MRGSLVTAYDVDHECMCKVYTACNNIYYTNVYKLLQITVTARLQDELRNLHLRR